MDCDNRFSEQFSNSTKIDNWQENRFRSSMQNILLASKQRDIPCLSYQQSLQKIQNSFECRASVSFLENNQLSSGVRGHLFNLGKGLVLSCALKREQLSLMQNVSQPLYLGKENSEQNMSSEMRHKLFDCVFTNEKKFKRRNIFTLLKICKEKYSKCFKNKKFNLEMKQKRLHYDSDDVDSKIIWEDLLMDESSPLEYGDLLVIRTHPKLHEDKRFYLTISSGDFGNHLIFADTQSLCYSEHITPSSVFEICSPSTSSVCIDKGANQLQLNRPFILKNVLSGKVLSDSGMTLKSIFGQEQQAICKSQTTNEPDLSIKSFYSQKPIESNINTNFSHIFFLRSASEKFEDFTEDQFSDQDLNKPFSKNEILNLIRKQIYSNSEQKAFCLVNLRHSFRNIDLYNTGHLSKENFSWGLKINSVQLTDFQIDFLMNSFSVESSAEFIDFEGFCSSLRMFYGEGRQETVKNCLESAELFKHEEVDSVKKFVNSISSCFVSSSQELDYFFKIISNYSRQKDLVQLEGILEFFADLSLAFPKDNFYKSFIASFFN